jgi:hypothetical protein
MIRTVTFALAALGLAASFSGAEATTLGLPIFKTAPTTVQVTNEFGPVLLPTDSYTLSFTSTIASAQGAPELVGQSISFSAFFVNGFDPGTVSSSLFIGGVDLHLDAMSFLITPPVATDVFDPGTGLSTFTYSGIFAGFGPRTAAFPDIMLDFVLSAAIPTRQGFLYCQTAAPGTCEFSNIAGLTEINGQAVTVMDSFNYPEGTISNAVATFSTVDGRPIPTTPLPAGGLLLLGAMASLGAFARCRTGRTSRPAQLGAAPAFTTA